MEVKLANVDGRLDGMEVKLNEIRKDLDQFRADVKGQFAEVQAAIQIVYDGVREVLDQQDIEAKERVHMDIVLKRHERWINGLANHAKLKLNQS
jgi:regulator of replication initiation timing